jgi:hypothetical protein
MRLAGWDVPDDELAGQVTADPASGIVPEIVTHGTPAWQRALRLNAERRRN